MSAAEITAEMLSAIRSLRQAHAELETQALAFADAERQYRRAKSIAYLRSPGKNVAEREANAEMVEVDGHTLNAYRHRRDLSADLKTSALEAVRSNRSILSALQSLSANERAEAELARYGGPQAQEAYA